MLNRKQRQLITYESITIYEKTYQLPIIKNIKLKKIQERIKECQKSIKEGIKCHSHFFGIIKRKQEISQREIITETKLLIRDYTQIIDLLENYKDSYKDFLLKFTDNWKQLFTQKYLEIKKLNQERKKLEIKNQHNPTIIDKLKQDKQENIKSILLLTKINILTLKKIQFISEGIKKISEDTKNQKQTIQQIVKDIEIYEEIYEYQIKAAKVRQEIATIAEMAINLENSLKDYFTPFQSLIDELVKTDTDFYKTVEEISNLASNTLNYQPNLLTFEETDVISINFLDLLVASYEKKDRLKEAFLQSQLLELPVDKIEYIDDKITLERAIYLISNYLDNQLVVQRKVLGITEENVVDINPHFPVQKTQFMELTNNNVLLKKEFKINKKKYKNITENIDYSHLQNLLAQSKWQEADIETAKLMLKIVGKNYWNEVYKQDIQNFSCKALDTIDRLWEQYSHAYFGFGIQQSIWNEIGSPVDYEKEKRFGDRLGWRKEGSWLEYEQLTFDLSSTTPIGHLPVKWLHYDQNICELSSNSFTEPLSMGAWRVESWLVWQMHLFFSYVEIGNQAF